MDIARETWDGENRPRGFVEDAALDEAMHLFWQSGYETTSLTCLMGVWDGWRSVRGDIDVRK